MVSRIARLIDLNEYKRRQAAPGLKVTSKDFGDNDDINDNDDGDCNHAQDMDEDDLLGLSDSEAPALHFIEDEDGFMLGSCDLPRPKQE